MGFYQFSVEQKIPATIEDVWDFISSPANLKLITPPYMGFEITTKDLPEKIFPGMIISYKVSPLFGIKLNWVTEITHVKMLEYFVDEQRLGPYSIWHHRHKIEAVEEGVVMTDFVSYKPPFGLIGDIANKIMIRKKLQEIFDFRRQAIENKFSN